MAHQLGWLDTTNIIRIYLRPDCPFILNNPNWQQDLMKNWQANIAFGQKTDILFHSKQKQYELYIDLNPQMFQFRKPTFRRNMWQLLTHMNQIIMI